MGLGSRYKFLWRVEYFPFVVSKVFEVVKVAAVHIVLKEREKVGGQTAEKVYTSSRYCSWKHNANQIKPYMELLSPCFPFFLAEYLKKYRSSDENHKPCCW